MWFPKPSPRRRTASLLAVAALLAARAAAQTAEGFAVHSNQPPRLASSLCPGEVVGNEQVLRQLLRSGTNEFVFVLPAGLSAQTAPDGTLVLSSRDLSFHLSLRLLPSLGVSHNPSQALRQQVAAQYSDASGLEEFVTAVAGREGTGYQLQHQLPQVGTRFVRLLWVPFKAGLIEFIVNADATNAPAACAAMDMVLLTFRSNERGPLEIIRRSDQS